MRRFFSLLLCIALLTAVLAPLSVSAADEPMQVITGGASNPNFEEPYIPTYDPPAPITVREKAPVYEKPEVAAKTLRDAMTAREDTITLDLYNPEGWAHADAAGEWVETVLLPMAWSRELAEAPVHGDYLACSWRDHTYTFSWNKAGYGTLVVSFRYCTTAGQEAALTAAVETLLPALNYGDSDYSKYAALNGWFAQNVAYDAEGLAAYLAAGEELGAQHIPHSTLCPFTAYGALVEGKAAGQGCAMAYYTLAASLGLPVRMVSDGSHGWTQILLGEDWYDVDVTGVYTFPTPEKPTDTPLA